MAEQGNIAALCKALLKASDILTEAAHHNLTEEYINECLAIIRAALAKPARNCDRFDNYSSAKDYFLENELWKYNPGLTPEYWFGVWLLAKAEGKDESNG